MTSSSNDDQTPVCLSALRHGFERGDRHQVILDGVSLELPAAQTLALIGRSGSGKSTLLNLIGGLEPIQQGDVCLFGHSLAVTNDRERTLLRRRHVGFIYQSFNLIPTLTVGDNVALPLALAGETLAKQQQKLQAVLVSVGLSERQHEYPDRLSGGEQQRVAIARALVHAPPLILADEPTGNLDAESGRQVLALLSSLVSESRSAMLLVTHSLEVARVADRALALSEGTLHSLTADQLAGSSAW